MKVNNPQNHQKYIMEKLIQIQISEIIEEDTTHSPTETEVPKHLIKNATGSKYHKS